MLVQGHQFPLLRSFHSREVHGVGDKMSGDSTTVKVQALCVTEIYLVD